MIVIHSSYSLHFNVVAVKVWDCPQSGGPIDRFSALFPYFLKTEAESGFLNIVILLFCDLDDGQSPEKVILKINYSSCRN
jgi:hypothetical protein